MTTTTMTTPELLTRISTLEAELHALRANDGLPAALPDILRDCPGCSREWVTKHLEARSSETTVLRDWITLQAAHVTLLKAEVAKLKGEPEPAADASVQVPEPVEDLSALAPAERAKREWEANAGGCRDRFTDPAAFAALRVRELEHARRA
jgi:hypothetical protein